MMPISIRTSTLLPVATALATFVFCYPAAQAASVAKTNYLPKVVNYTTATPVNPQPFLMPYGYTDTARGNAQVIMSGVSPSIIDAKDTSFEILALVRPGSAPLQKVVFGQGQANNPLFNYSLKHINTLKNGDQFWKYTFTFEAGSFPNGVIPIKWGGGTNQFFIQATESTTAAKPSVSNAFPLLTAGSFIANTSPYIDTSKNDVLSYDTTKRIAAQVSLAGVSPAIVDIRDTSFDIVAVVRPGLIPLQNVIVKQTGNALFSVALEKKKVLNNNDEIWAANFPFAAGTFGTSTIPVVWGTDVGEYNIQVVDIAQQSATAYPNLRVGSFPLVPKP